MWMATRVARKPAAPRTQRERSAETRAKIVIAATECVAEEGFRAATMGAIAERAGVSWGAIQHQFREKGALLDAVLENSVGDLEASLSGLREREPDPVKRVQVFVRRCRELSGGPAYRAFVEIQMGRAHDEAWQASEWSAHLGVALAQLWRDLFGDLGLGKRRLEDAQRFTFVVLNGIAAESMLFPGVDFTRRHFEILEKTLLDLLELEAS